MSPAGPLEFPHLPVQCNTTHEMKRCCVQFYYDLQIFALYIQKQTRSTYAPVCPTVMVGNQVCFG